MLHFYQPQTKFSEACVKNSVHSGVPGQVQPRDQVHPSDQVHTPRMHAGRYGQQAGGTHPAGMHSCLVLYFIRLIWRHKYSSLVLDVMPPYCFACLSSKSVLRKIWSDFGHEPYEIPVVYECKNLRLSSFGRLGFLSGKRIPNDWLLLFDFYLLFGKVLLTIW